MDRLRSRQEKRYYDMKDLQHKLAVHKKTPIRWAVSDPWIITCDHSKFVTCRYCTPYTFNWEEVSDDEIEIIPQKKTQWVKDDGKFEKWKKIFLAQCKDSVMDACKNHLLGELKDEIMDDIWGELNDVLQDFRK